MISIKTDHTKTCWVEIPGGVETIVVHCKSGHTEKMSLVDYLTLKNKKNIIKIDCYFEGENVKEE